ncbi:MAG: GntR family transcriptional regulator [Oscillospiraceae bacterium]|nr:GntR family transcriptional regulator [Oscillospiraceae bacterium]
MTLDRKNKLPIYKQIYDILLVEINNGTYNKNGVLPTEKELCERFGTERNTVRKALQIFVNEGRIIRRKGSGTRLVYQSPVMHNGALSDASQLLNKSVMLAAQEDYLNEGDVESFHYKLINSFDKRLSGLGLSLIYKTLGSNGLFSEALRNASPSAVIFDSYIQSSFHREALQFGMPCLSVNHYTPLMTSIVSNNYNGAYQVAKSLTDAGHRKIALLLGKRSHQTCIERMSGFQSLYMSRGMTLEDRYLFTGNWLFSSGVEAAERIAAMAPEDRPTAVFAFNDDMAYGCYSSFERRGISVPGDVSVVGFDKSDRYDSIFPPLTTVDVNMEAIVDYACWFLINNLLGKTPNANAKIQLEVKLVDNGSIMAI